MSLRPAKKATTKKPAAKKTAAPKAPAKPKPHNAGGIQKPHQEPEPFTGGDAA